MHLHAECLKNWLLVSNVTLFMCSGVPKNFVWGGVQQIQLRTEDRENGDLGVVAT